jgi:hypothetical protein
MKGSESACSLILATDNCCTTGENTRSNIPDAPKRVLEEIAEANCMKTSQRPVE